ncbi:unnamed protein product [Protopolystoma xenopodis]|uniref:Uncharacterized protein n=1 Tax=Protopolystoma xenopodis TaxID=117903 RepID=A0A448XL52_9PLAT|nr:unnamed protein product [Protopolystoma xenopodis]
MQFTYFSTQIPVLRCTPCGPPPPVESVHFNGNRHACPQLTLRRLPQATPEAQAETRTSVLASALTSIAIDSQDPDNASNESDASGISVHFLKSHLNRGGLNTLTIELKRDASGKPLDTIPEVCVLKKTIFHLLPANP